MKRILSIFICLVMLLSFAACAKTKKEPSDAEIDEALAKMDITKVEGDISILLPGTKPNDGDYVLGKVNEKLAALDRKYTISIKYESWADYWNKVPLGVGKYDMFGMHTSFTANFYADRYLADISKYVNKLGTDIKSTTPQATLDACTIDNKLVAVPRVGKFADPEPMFATRSDFMAGAAGNGGASIANPYTKDTIETVQDYQNYTKAVKQYITAKNLAGTYVTDKHNGTFLRREYAKNFYFPLGSFGCTPVYIDVSQKIDGKYKVQSWYESEGFQNTAKVARAEFVGGYKQSAIGAVSDQDKVFKEGLQAVIWDLPYRQNEIIDSFKDNEANANVTYESFYLNPDDNKWVFKATDNQMCVYRNTSIDKTAMCVDFLNLLRKEKSLSDLLFYGEADRNHKLVGEKLSYDGIAGSKKYYFPYTFFNTPESTRFSVNVPDEDVAMVNNWDKGDNVKVSPLNGFTFSIKGDAAEYLGQISSMDVSYVNGFMYGDMDVTGAKYTEFVNKIKPYMDKLIVELQKQVDAYVSANGL